MTDAGAPYDRSRHLVVAGTDGSERATAAIRAGLDVVGPSVRLLLVTVVAAPDMSLVTGTGFAGGVMSLDEKQDMVTAEHDAAQELLVRARDELGVPDADLEVREGDAGDQICRAADEHGADAIVIGTRGTGGVRRFVLGSVSDHVVRNAPCPVITVGDGHLHHDQQPDD